MRLFRRLLLTGGALAAMALPAASQTPPKVLRVVPQTDVTMLDPLYSTAWISVISGTMIWETLFAWDSKMQPQPQMVSDWGASPNGLIWRFTLRDGLRFHDGQPVTVRDVLPSLRRWMAIDTIAAKIGAITAEMATVDDRTFEWRLSRPFPNLIAVLAAAPSRFPAIMRAQDIPEPGKPATTTIGSGPFRFNAAERVPGARLVYERNADYVPRSEPPDGLAGGRVVKVDRVEFTIMSDPATAAAALQNGEVDFVEKPALDLVPLLSRNKQIRLERLTDLAGQGLLRPNTLYPPFNDRRAREALAYAIDQGDEMAAGYGDEQNWQRCNSFFVCGTPYGTEAGAEDFHQDLDRARRLMAEAGYKGEKIVFFSTHEIPWIGAMAEVAVDAMRKAGMNVDVTWADWATTVSRSGNQDPPDVGGWNAYVTAAPGPLMWNPSTNIGTNMSCDRKNFAGWPCDEESERLRQQFLEADDAARPAVLDKLHRRLAFMQPYRVLGQANAPVAYRAGLYGVLHSPVVTYWNISKD